MRTMGIMPSRVSGLRAPGAAAFLLAVSLAALPILGAAGCAAAQERLDGTLHAYEEDLQSWQEEGERWMRDFQAMSLTFPRPLPQLRPDSAYNRHLAQLALFRDNLDARAGEPDALRKRHAELGRTHEELRQAYGNMVKLAERYRQSPNARPRPEIAEDVPQ
jgi:hypothetical protein